MTKTINTQLTDPALLEADRCQFFYDWFCKDEALEGRRLRLEPTIKWLVEEGLVNGDACYYWLKNNCPMIGGTYDDIRISTADDANDFLGGFCKAKGHVSVWFLDGDDLEQHEFETWAELKKALRTDDALRARCKACFRVA
uniref:Uncharacterized protein n=1 Tax=Dinoroseobacter phage vB_DshS_R26L TaxID=3161158 RepID=A0AAU7VGX7_9CAUD